MACNVVAALIPLSSDFTVFVTSPQPFGVIVACLIFYVILTVGWFYHQVGQRLILLSILLRGLPTYTTTGIVSSPLRIILLEIFPP